MTGTRIARKPCRFATRTDGLHRALSGRENGNS